MVRLPSAEELSILHGQFILVKTTEENGVSSYRIGVDSVAPGARVQIDQATDCDIYFANGLNPLSNTVEDAGGSLVRYVANPNAIGIYQFAISPGTTTPNEYPYMLHVASDGNLDVRCRCVNDKMRVVLAMDVQPEKFVNIGFVKEHFDDDVTLSIIGSNQSAHELTIPQGQEEGIWQVNAGQSAVTYTITVSGSGNGLHHVYWDQVVGSDEGDLEINPTGG